MPFHRLGPFAAVVAIQKGERPRKPESAESLGFSDILWRLVQMCWSESPSARPTARDLLRHIQDASHTWVSPPEYPAPDGHDGGAGLDLASDDEPDVATGALANRLFVLMVRILCFLFLPFT